MLRRKLFLSGIAVFVSLSLCFVVSVEAESLMWSQLYGGKYNESAFSLVVTSDGGYAIAGYTSSFGVGGYDFWLVKTNAYGNMIWNQTYGRPKNDIAQSLIVTSDGGFAIAGRTTFFDSLGPFDFWLVKTDSFGFMEWNQTYGGEFDDWAYSLVETSNGGYVIAGYTNSSGAGNYDFWLVRTDEFGNVEWNLTYGGTEREEAYALVATSDGGYAIAGSTYSFGAGGADFWLVKTDASGNVEWNRTYGGTEHDMAQALVATSDGGYAIAGTTNSFGNGFWDFWLVKTDEFGNSEWNKTYGGPEKNERICSVVETSDGGYAIAGYTRIWNSEIFLGKTDEFGNMAWNQTWSAGFGSAWSLIETSDGGYGIAGNIANDFCFLKTDEYGIIPEYSSFLLPSLLLVATLVIVVCKKKRLNIQWRDCVA